MQRRREQESGLEETKEALARVQSDIIDLEQSISIGQQTPEDANRLELLRARQTELENKKLEYIRD